MSPWHIELLRHARTRRLHGVILVMGFLGLAQPVFAAYGEQIVRAMGAGSGPAVSLPPPSVEVALGGYLGQVASLGMLVVAGVAVTSFAVDSRYALAVFYRTRARSMPAVLVPRLVVGWVCAIAGFTIGLAAAVYETVVLLGPVGVGAIARVWLAGASYLTLVVSACLLAGVLSRSVVRGFASVAATFLIAMPLVAMIPSLREWVPTPALPGLVEGWTSAQARAMGTAAVGAMVLTAVALGASRRRRLPRH